METVERDYRSRGVDFYYIYKALAHPETNGYVTPLTQQERLMHVAEAKRKLGTRFEWLCDSIDNDLKHALGNAPNSEFVIDPDGKIVVSRSWSNPQQLRKDLAELVGGVEKPTTVAEVGMKPLEPPKTAPTGIVPRVSLTGRPVPVRVTAVDDQGEPFYVKLRAEIDADYFSRGEGKLYLGFFLDPLYKVHWNNQTDPPEFDIATSGDVEVSSNSGKGPAVEAPADADPREFLLDVNGKGSLTITLRYFACDDAETFCKPVTQKFLVKLERDQDGGSRRAPRSGARGSSRNATSGRAGAGTLMSERMQQMMRRLPVFAALDRDRDGAISQRELEAAPRLLKRLDRDGDGELSAAELRPQFPSQRRR